MKPPVVRSELKYAVFTLTVAVGVQDRPADAPTTGDFKSDWKLIGNPSFAEAISALSSMVFAYAGTPAFFSIISEMRNPKDYNKALIACQGTVTAVYTAIGIVVYYFCGSYVASPALGSAGYLMKKVCYGLALPGLLVSCLILLHVRYLRGCYSHDLGRANKHTATGQIRFHPLAEGIKASH